jgi:hypothetical protein
VYDVSRFRDNLYVDAPAVERLLSSIEGGVYDSVDERLSQSSQTVGDGGNIDLPEAGTPSTTQTHSTERSRRIMQNADSRFSRLWRAAQDDPDEAVLEASSGGPDLWENATEGRFCAISGELQVPPAIGLLANSSEILQFGRVAQQFGIISPQAEEMQQIEAMSALQGVLKDRLPVILRCGPNQVPVALPLNPEHSRVKTDEYIGRAVVYGRVVERVARRSSFTLLQIPGAAQVPNLSRQQRRQAERTSNPTTDNGTTLPGPAIVLRVLAIAQ